MEKILLKCIEDRIFQILLPFSDSFLTSIFQLDFECYISVDTNTYKMQQHLLYIHKWTHTVSPHTNITPNLHWVFIARCWQWGLWGNLCEERPGLPHAGHGQFQLALTDPLQGMAEPFGQDGSSGKTDLRKGKKCWTGRGGRKKRVKQ